MAGRDEVKCMDCGAPIDAQPGDIYVICLTCMVEREKDDIDLRERFESVSPHRGWEA